MFGPMEDAFVDGWLRQRQADGTDKPGEPPLKFKIRETVTLAKFDHTPAEGEALDPFETVVVHHDVRTVTAPSSQE